MHTASVTIIPAKYDPTRTVLRLADPQPLSGRYRLQRVVTFARRGLSPAAAIARITSDAPQPSAEQPMPKHDVARLVGLICCHATAEKSRAAAPVTRAAEKARLSSS